MFSLGGSVVKTASRLCLLVGGFFFPRLVPVSHRTDEPYALGSGRNYSLRSLLHLLGRLGTLGLAALARAGRAILDMLYEASADVGEWYVRRPSLPLNAPTRDLAEAFQASFSRRKQPKRNPQVSMDFFRPSEASVPGGRARSQSPR